MADAQKKTALDPIPFGAGTGRRSAIHPQAGSGGKLVLDGTTDNSAALAGLAAGVGYDLPAGTCYVGASCTVTANVNPQPGFMIQPELGVKVRFDGPVSPVLHRWIDLSLGGEVVFGPEAGALYEAWWVDLGLSNCTAQLQAAIDATRELSAENHEPTLVWRGATIPVGYISMRGCSRVRNIFLGNTILLGVDFSGIPRILDIDGGTDVVAPMIQVVGLEFGPGLSVQTALVGYEYGVYISFVTDSHMPKFVVSGSYSEASVFLQACWNNEFHFYATNSNPAATAVVQCSDTSVNDNIIRVRIAGAGAVGGSTYGLIAAGRGNLFTGDISTVPNGVDVSLVYGSSFLCYLEAVGTDNYTTTYINNTGKAVTVLGGHISLSSGATAFNLGGQGGVNGFNIVSCNVEGIPGGSNRQLFDYGASGLAYGVSYGMGLTISGIDTEEIGLKRWATGGFSLTGEIQAHALSFPPVQRASDDEHTLDDYEEGTWTPVISFVTPGDLAVSYAVDAQEGIYTKVGDLVTVEGVVQTSSFTHSTASGNFLITGLPFTSKNAAGGQSVGGCAFGGITKAGYTQIQPLLNVNTTNFRLGASGSAQPFALVTAADVPSGGTVALYFTLVYKATS